MARNVPDTLKRSEVGATRPRRTRGRERQTQDLLSIVVPTYNERQNLAELLGRLDATLVAEDIPYEVIVVDDDSPDRTWEAARGLSDEFPVRTIRRTEERGLATAVLRGIEAARAPNLLVMDADLQHPPEKVPELFDALESGADVVIGSRFVDGGDLGEFGPFRRAISWTADTLARTLFQEVRDVEDIQSGFFAFRSESLEGGELSPTGYKILLEILVIGDPRAVEEVPFTFGQRYAGESKLGVREVLDYVSHLASLAWRTGELHRMAKFALVGLMGALANLAIFTLLTWTGLHYLWSGALAIEAGLLTNFAINSSWTFRDRRATGAGPLARCLWRDHVVRAGGLTINLGTLLLLTAGAGFAPITSQACGILAGMTWNLLGNLWWTWETTASDGAPSGATN